MAASTKVNKAILRAKTTEISDPMDYDLSNLEFDSPNKTEGSGNIPPFYRINIFTRIGKTESDLVFEMDRCRMFGIKETVDNNTNNLTGYSCGIMMFDQGAPSERQIKTLEVFQQVVEKCKDHLMNPDVKKSVGKSTIKVREQLDSISPVSFMKDKETQEPDQNAPVLNAKLIYAKEKRDKENNIIPGRIISKFYLEDEVDGEGNPQEVNPLEYINKKGWIRAAIRFESIFVGKDIKIQVKIYEAELKTEDKTSHRRLLRFGGSRTNEIEINLTPSVPVEEETPSTGGDDEDATPKVDVQFEQEQEEEPQVKKVVKKKTIKN